MTKKEVLILVIVGVLVAVIAGVLVFSLNKKKDSEEPKKDQKTEQKTEAKDVVQTSSYTLDYGKYIGYEEEYNHDTQKVEKKEIIIEIGNNKAIINNETQSFVIKGDSLYVNNYEMYQVTGNNKFTMTAGQGIEFTYKEK